ncbi:oxidoreductase [Pseudonocardia sp. HH130630-07]|uniref:oxidoreductase n=1 Tax=Pseudonocardia sp. HH130630-07 TaxID=1690815 RepID=UPI0008153668|nr:oxidoreductase [Pseudonocardia sp. HH130630-07]ANY07757.1 oxidoreductase [Pseudonocardia sp. HH130630-07]
MTAVQPMSTAELVDRARALGPLVAEHSARGDRDRRLPDEVVSALTDAGLFDLSVPRALGGPELPVRGVIEVAAAVAESDGAAGWVTAIYNSCAWMAALFPDRAREEVFGGTGGRRVSGVVAGTAETAPVDGGYRVSGRWPYNSGSWHADWAVLGVPVTGDDGTVLDQALALVPTAACRVEDTWDVAGMRGTGSNTLVVDDVVVPLHRMFSVTGALRDDHVDGPGSPYRSAFLPYVSVVLTGPLLGLGRAALSLVTAKAHDKAIAYTTYERQADSVAFQLAVAQAATELDTAELHALRAADDVDAAAQRSEPLSPLVRARVRADISRCVECVLSAVDGLVSAHGAGSFATPNRLQRIWRDTGTAARHAVLAPALGYELYGKALLDVPNTTSPFV